MGGDYEELLEASIRHLEDLRRDGTRYVTVDSALLASLAGSRKAGMAPRVVVSRPSGRPPAVESPRPAEARSAIEVEASSEPPLIAPGGPPLTRAEKEAAFAPIRDRALVCVKCPHLAASRKNVVFGVGDIHSPLMFVGEAPGADEDKEGEPFVGRAGELLTKIIQAMGHTRQTVYIANILKCRPDTPGQAFGNRKPTAEEIKNCLPYLRAQIDLIRPKVMIALGGTALEGLFGKTTAGITKLRGRWQEFQGIPVMPTYHPSYLLRNQLVSVKREVWEDMLQALEKLGATISEKQRNFFK